MLVWLMKACLIFLLWLMVTFFYLLTGIVLITVLRDVDFDSLNVFFVLIWPVALLLYAIADIIKLVKGGKR